MSSDAENKDSNPSDSDNEYSEENIRKALEELNKKDSTPPKKKVKKGEEKVLTKTAPPKKKIKKVSSSSSESSESSESEDEKPRRKKKLAARGGTSPHPNGSDGNPSHESERRRSENSWAISGESEPMQQVQYDPVKAYKAMCGLK